MRQLIIYISALVLLPASMLLARQGVNIDTDESYVSYTGRHTLHGWTGTSHSIEADLVVDPENPSAWSVHIRIPVETFDSGNDNRDSDMMDVTNVDTHPYVVFTSSDIQAESWESSDTGSHGVWQVTGILDFHGVEREYTIPVEVSVEQGRFQADTAFEVQVSDHDIRRPRLMFIPISDTITLEAHLVGTME